MRSAVHPVDEHLPATKLIPLAVQHVLVMCAGAVAVALIIGRAVNLPPDPVALRLLRAEGVLLPAVVSVILNLFFNGVESVQAARHGAAAAAAAAEHV